MNDIKNNSDNGCFAVVRGSNNKFVITAIADIYRHARLKFDGDPKSCDTHFADDILIKVMNQPLKFHCKSAAVVHLLEDPAYAIAQIVKIHPPAHIIILSSRYNVFKELMDIYDKLPCLDFTVPKLDNLNDNKDKIDETNNAHI